MNIGLTLESVFESLESRTLLSTGQPFDVPIAPPPPLGVIAAAEEQSYSLMTLLGYDQRGASWKYASEVTATTSDGTGTVTGKSTVSIARKQKLYAGLKSNVVVSSAKGSKVTTAWAQGVDGTQQTFFSTKVGPGSMKFQVISAVAAPQTLVPGETHTDSGEIVGTFKIRLGGRSLTGQVTGTADCATTLLAGTTEVVVAPGTYETHQILTSFSFEGAITFRYRREEIVINLSGEFEQTAFAAPGIGIVKAEMAMTMTVEYDGDSETAQVTGTTELLKLPKHVLRAQRAKG